MGAFPTIPGQQGGLLNTLIRGIAGAPEAMQGMSAAQDIIMRMRQADMQKQQMDRLLRRDEEERQQREYEKQEYERKAAIDDIRNQMMLRSAGRPIEAGLISEQMVGPSIEGAPESIQPGPTTVYRKPDSANVVKYKTRDGRTIETELYTPEEQLKRQAELADSTARAEDERAVRRARLMQGVTPFTLKPGEQRFAGALSEAGNGAPGQPQAPIASVPPATKAPTEWQSYLDAAGGDSAKALKMKQAAQMKLRQSTPALNLTIPGLTAGSSTSQLTGDEFLKTLPPGTSAQIKAIAEGREKIPPVNARGSSALLRDAVYKYDPTFTEQRAQIRRAFTAGPDAKNIGALNTAIVHLGRLHETSRALGNGSFTPGNELYNYFKDKFGSQVVTNFTLLKDAIAGEMASALKGNATDIEIEKMGKSIRAANSPEQMMGVVREGMGILHDKANTYAERYHALMPDDPWSPVLPSAKAMLEKYSVNQAGHGGGAGGAAAPIVQHSPSTGQYRYSTDGGKTWHPGRPQ